MSTTAQPPLRTLDLDKVRERLAHLEPLVGGWGTPNPRHAAEKSHYFRAHTDAEGEHYLSGAALCGYIDNRNELDVDECDPLAPENCPTCRRELLTLRKLI